MADNDNYMIIIFMFMTYNWYLKSMYFVLIKNTQKKLFTALLCTVSKKEDIYFETIHLRVINY